MKILIINGPNLNLLGKRDTEIYGSETFPDTLEKITGMFPDIDFDYIQSNSEGEIIDAIQSSHFNHEIAGIVINPGAYAHYSYAIADAIGDANVPVVEVHISNIHAREEFRAKSVTARAADAIISGCGREGYALAVNYLISLQHKAK